MTKFEIRVRIRELNALIDRIEATSNADTSALVEQVEKLRQKLNEPERR